MKKLRKPKPPTRRDVPATVGLVVEVREELVAKIEGVRSELKGEIQSVRDELKGEIQSVRNELKGEIQSVRTELKGEIQSVRTELKGEIQSFRTELKGEMNGLRTDLSVGIQQVLAATHRSQAIAEEQRAENRIILEGLHNVNERMDRLEYENVEIRRFLKTLRSPRN